MFNQAIALVCVLSPDQFNAFIGNNAQFAYAPQPPTGNCTDLTKDNVLWLDANGDEIPGQRDETGALLPVSQRRQTDPQAPPTLVALIPPKEVHFFEEGIATPLEGVTDLGCISRNGTALSYVIGAQSCLDVLPLKTETGSWQLWVNDPDGLPAGCLAHGADDRLTFSSRCVGDTNFMDDFPAAPKDTEGKMFALRTEGSPKCLTYSGSSVFFSDCHSPTANSRLTGSSRSSGVGSRDGAT